MHEIPSQFPYRWVAALLPLCLAACAPTTSRPQVDDQLVARERMLQNQLAVERIFKHEERLFRVAWQVASGGRELCEQRRPGLGMLVMNRYSYGRDWADALTVAKDLGEELKVVSVAPGSPAAVGGLQVGDRLLALGGSTPRGEKASLEFGKMLATQLQGAGSVSLRVARGGVEQTLDLTARSICGYPVRLASNDAVNAFADGKQVVITTGMMRFTENDQELALVVGHELAHNLMGHIEKQVGNRLLGTLLDAAIAIGAGVDTRGSFTQMAGLVYSKDFESEADYVGLYMVALSGYELTDAANFWRRMGVEHPGSINHASTHPATPERFVAIDRTIVEIREKQRLGFDLRPELR